MARMTKVDRAFVLQGSTATNGVGEQKAGDQILRTCTEPVEVLRDDGRGEE